jgi:aromatic-L-amino-acid decarboxylase
MPDPAPHASRLGDLSPDEFRRFGYQVIDWLAGYQSHPERYRVQPDVRPGGLLDSLPASGPEEGEALDRILADFERQILPHVTHWNHPGFMGYFATSGCGPGILAEALAAGLNNIGLLWKTSPALVELEQLTLRWLAAWLGLPPEWFGMILDTASVASLHAVIAAREAARSADQAAGRECPLERMVIYTSEQAHSSIEKTMLALGLGRGNCRKIPVDDEFRLKPVDLQAAIRHDLDSGLRPFCVVATVGTTSTASIDPVAAIAGLAERHGLWLHVDAAYGGVAALVPEKRPVLDGCGRADSFVVNPHKWLFTPMDCSAFYCRRPEELRRALSLVPAYLDCTEDPRAVNFMEYAVPLGRRFRALKLWFILRYYGREGLAANLREHMRLAAELARWIDEHRDFERVAPVTFSLVCFRYCPRGADPTSLNDLNRRLIEAVNAAGEFFLSSTVLNERFILRAAIGNIRTTASHVERLWEILKENATALK